MFELGLEVINLLEYSNFKAFIVGGYPRDMYLGRESYDIDIATSAKYDDLVKIFRNVKENGYMSYIVEYKSNMFQVTTFRRDISYFDNRKPDKQETVDTIEEDLKRRDFIMNTLCIDKDGKLLDFMNAKRDIDNKIIRTVKNPEQSFREDALRMLRCVRFCSILGFDMSPDVKSALINNRGLIKGLSFFRKKEELDKIFKDINYQRGINLIKELGLEEVLSIKIENNIKDDNYLKIWSKIKYDDNYPFTREEKRILNTYIDYN